MKTLISKISMILLLFSKILVINVSGQDIPLVYDVEFTGVDCTKPPLPALGDLPVIEPLTDPFEWSDGSDRDTAFTAWTRRRAEIKAEIEHYEIGLKPERPDSINAVVFGDTALMVSIIRNSDTLNLYSRISLPDGEGPFPAVIGMVWIPGFGSTGGLPSDIFTSRNIASIEYVHDQVTTYASPFGGGPSISDPYFQLYPEQNLTNSGQYSAWAWGVSRLIDGLELVQDSLPIDLEHLAVTGCSYAGKMALFAGALDERIALTIAQESGGGGAPAWRVSETLGNVERLHSTDHNWFKEDMFDFGNTNVAKLPHDHHELMALCAPRALLVTGNINYEWLANPSCYVSAAAAQEVYSTFDIGDRFGYYIDGGHDHCAIPASQRPAIEAFVDKFLLGDSTVNTDVETHPYPDIIPEYWFDWWGTGDPEFAVLDRGDSEEVWFEAECATVGKAWNVRLDTTASNESYAVPKPGLNSNSNAPVDSGAAILFPFTVDQASTFYVYGRINCSSRDHDSYWVKIDDEDFVAYAGLVTEGWEWMEFTSFNLSAGEHTLAISYREDSTKLDKICISAFQYPPGKLGEGAEFTCEPDTVTREYNIVGLDEVHAMQGYILGQNYPNPLTNSTSIAFEIPENNYVSLKVYSILGEEIAELAGNEYAAGSHIVEFNAQNLSKGIYIYTLKAGELSISRKMILQKE